MFKQALSNKKHKAPYFEYLLTKLRVNPEAITQPEKEILRKIEYMCKLHDEAAVIAGRETLLDSKVWF